MKKIFFFPFLLLCFCTHEESPFPFIFTVYPEKIESSCLTKNLPEGNTLRSCKINCIQYDSIKFFVYKSECEETFLLSGDAVHYYNKNTNTIDFAEIGFFPNCDTVLYVRKGGELRLFIITQSSDIYNDKNKMYTYNMIAYFKGQQMQLIVPYFEGL